jgi:hypothetical protein
MREILYPVNRIEISLNIHIKKNLPYKIELKIYPNAPQAAAVRVLADFIFVFCFHFISHNYFPSLQTPH